MTIPDFRSSLDVMEMVSFSDLQLRGKATVERWLRTSASRVLVVRRRDAEDLVLTTATRAAQAHEASSATSRLLTTLMQREPQVRQMLTDVAPEVFPWLAFLSPGDRAEFVAELTSTIRAAESIDNPAPVAQVIDSWRHTAELLADPELAAVLSASTDADHGLVPKPQARGK